MILLILFYFIFARWHPWFYFLVDVDERVLVFFSWHFIFIFSLSMIIIFIIINNNNNSRLPGIFFVWRSIGILVIHQSRVKMILSPTMWILFSVDCWHFFFLIASSNRRKFFIWFYFHRVVIGFIFYILVNINVRVAIFRDRRPFSSWLYLYFYWFNFFSSFNGFLPLDTDFIQRRWRWILISFLSYFLFFIVHWWKKMNANCCG